MKIKLIPFSAIAFSLALFFTACKKDNSNSGDNKDYTAELSAQSDDQEQVTAEIDAISDDAEAAITSDASMSGRIQSICDAEVSVNADSDPKTVTITYDGSNCLGNRTRSGVVILSMPKNVHWKDAGAVLTITVQNLKITRKRDNKSITINGTKTITNVSGGLLVNLSSTAAIIHSIDSDGITVKFDNGKERNWKVALLRTFTYNNGIVVSETGTHTDGTNTGIAVWGTNRFGNEFASSITTPLVVRQDCDFRLVSGAIMHVNSFVTATATFGLDSAGNVTSCPGTGSYYYKVVWTGSGGNSLTVILPY